MKGEDLESPSDQPGAATPSDLFAKFHNPFSLHFRPSPPSPDEPSPSPKAKNPADPPSGDGSTIEVVRRRRGRPPGSKNKPKPPIVITRDADPSLSPYILEVPCGSDVVASLHSFCRRRSLSLSVLSASGSVSDFTLRQPVSSPGPGATLTFHGRFDILSISATLFPRSLPASFGATAPPNAFSISLAGPQGLIVGGSVAGPLVAAGPVFVVAASFNSPMFCRLTDGDEEAENARRAASEAGSGGGGEGQSPQMSSGGDSWPGHQRQAEPVYSRHMSADAIWAPAPRQPPPPPPPYH